MAVNIPLLRKAVEWVEAEAARPEGGNWNQGSWIFKVASWLEFRRDVDDEDVALEALGRMNVNPSCGTAYCVAGYIAQLLDGRFAESEWVDLGDGHQTHVSDFAQDQLGLTDDQGATLFAAGNTAEHVRRIAEEFAGGPL